MPTLKTPLVPAAAAVMLASIAGLLLIQQRGTTGDEDGGDSGSSGFGRSGQPGRLPPTRLIREEPGRSEELPKESLPDSYEHSVLREVLEPFDQEELADLLADPDKNASRLTDLIHRAAAEKDVRFRYMLKDSGLREPPAMDLAIAAYDYAVNGSEEALAHVLTVHARQAPGSDSDSVVTLSYIDEWDRTIAAYRNHFAQGTDGAGGIAKQVFLLRRKHLFPQQFRRFQQQEREQGAETER